MDTLGNWVVTVVGMEQKVVGAEVQQSPKLKSFSFHEQALSSYRALSDKCIEWPPNDPEYCRGSNVP